ncbi:MAG TPA: FIST N-terminal domain-containing protein [Candidatus Omnitrophota bacterium]|nr:FIST N-terminal domain-containing protein [Candidatus Omnitrophota bacterium]
MSSQIGIGFSSHLDAEQAATEAILQAQIGLGSPNIDLIILLSTIHYDPQTVIQSIHQTIHCKKLIGCSTAGIILSESVQTRGIAILAMVSDDIHVGISSIENLDKINLEDAGKELARNILSDFGPHSRQIFLSFIDGQIADYSSLLKGLQGIFGNIFPIIGAGSSDDLRLEKTFQFYQNHTSRYSANGLILGGQINVGIGAGHGWRPLGKPRIITKTEKNIIKEIDGKKAALLYEQYFEDKALDLYSTGLNQMTILYPLGVYIEGNKEYLLRNAIQGLEDGSIICQGDVPSGAEVHIMIGNKESCRNAALEAAQEAKKNLFGKPAKLVIIIESMARLKLLGRMAHQEIAIIKQIFGATTPLLGMYSNGEICPFESVDKFKKPLIQNESIVILAIG